LKTTAEGDAVNDQEWMAAEQGAQIRPVPQQRIMEKVDECMSRKDYPGVERVLLYWLEEAKAGRDLRGQLMIRNELVGHYRKTGERDKAHESAEDALRLLRELDYENSVSAGTTWVNIATAYNSFGENQEALALFEKARQVYERSAGADASLLGGLYNNMGLSCAALEKYDEALALYEKAMATMKNVPRGALEQAVTCLNMANAVEGKLGLEQAESRINELLDQGLALLDRPDIPRNGYYAYVCEHCAPTFDYYGYFLTAEDLRARAEALYERT